MEEHLLVVKMKNKILLTLILVVILISFASAQIQTAGTFKINEQINLTQTCASCTFNNITSIEQVSPTSRGIIGNFQMTRVGSIYNFSLSEGNNTQIGEFYVHGIGDLEGKNEIWNFNYFVTQTGFTLETSDSILLIVILIGTFVLFLGFLWPSIVLPYSNKTNPDGSITQIVRLKYLKLLSIWFAYGFLMWFLQTLNLISTSFIKLTNLTNFITNVFTYSFSISLGVTLLILSILFIETWKDIILSNTIKRFGKAFMDGRLQ